MIQFYCYMRFVSSSPDINPASAGFLLFIAFFSSGNDALYLHCARVVSVGNVDVSNDIFGAGICKISLTSFMNLVIITFPLFTYL